MENLVPNTLWRERSSCAKILQKIVAACRDRQRSDRPLTDRLARDAGIDPAELEHQRIKWPSQTTYHPML